MTELGIGTPQDDPFNMLPTVQFYTKVHEVRITDLPTDQNGSTTDLLIRLAPDISVENLPGRLSGIYDAVGPGEHDTRAVADATDVHVNSILAIARRLGSILPPQLIRLEHADGNRGMSLHLGAMAIEQAAASDDQVAAFELRAAAIEAAKNRRAKEAMLTADKEKINLTEHDHAIIDFRDRRFYLLLDDPGMILAGRVVSAVAELRETRGYAHTSDLAAQLWEGMPIAERVLYTDDDAVVYSNKFPNKILGRSVEGILESLTGRMGITRRGRATGEYVLPSGELELNFHQDPLSDNDSQGLTLIFPQASELALKTLSAEDIARATELAVMATGDPRGLKLNEEASIALLDDVTSPPIKRALLVALRRSGIDMPIGTALHNLHRIVQYNLGYFKHSVAWRNRTVGGGLWRRTASQAGGTLPADRTNWTLGQFERDVRTWTFQTLRLTKPDSADTEQ